MPDAPAETENAPPSDISPAAPPNLALAPQKIPRSAYPATRGNARGKVMVPNRRLTRQEDAFCVNVLQGWPYWRCYMLATGSNCRKSGAEVGAWRMMNRPAVQAELMRRRQAMDENQALTRTEKRVILAQLARDPGTPALARIGAVTVENRMTGHDAPINVNVSGRVVFSVDPIARDDKRAAISPDAPAIDV